MSGRRLPDLYMEAMSPGADRMLDLGLSIKLQEMFVSKKRNSSSDYIIRARWLPLGFIQRRQLVAL